MSRWLKSGLAAIVFFLWLAPAGVSAYSYGDANTEDVAETFKVIASALNGSKPDWKTAADTHQVRRSEIKSHFGESVALTLDKNLEAKDSKLLIANYKAVLVMNLDRRFTYALKDVEDYAAAKLLLAKAKATFDTLAPYMSSGTDDINRAFEDALEALGNPGLFGVGQKDADPELFKQKVNFIYGKVKPSFPYKAYVKPAATEKPVKQPTATPQPQPTKAPAATNKPAASAKPAAADAEKETDEATPTPSPSSEPEASPSASPEASASPEPSATDEAAAAEASPPAATGSQEATDEPKADSEVSAQAASGEEQALGHAPMERSDKTNPIVTVSVIAGVAIIGGGALWFIRKKGFM